MSDKAFKNEIEIIKGFIKDTSTVIMGPEGDSSTVIMGPDIGDSSKGTFNSKLRVYSHGGRILDLATRARTIIKFFPKGNYSYPEEFKEKKNYKDLNKKDIEDAIQIAKNRAEGTSEDDKKYKEREVETTIAYNNRSCNNAKAIIIDMEFTCPKAWIGKKCNSKTGKPDLIVYDMKTNSFGLIELKVDNKSTDNKVKHFENYYDMLFGDKKKKKKEFMRKMEYLMHYELIPNVSEKDLKKALNNDMWAAFLFVGGVEKTSRTLFNKGKQSFEKKNKIKNSEFGYQHCKNAVGITLTRKAFFKV